MYWTIFDSTGNLVESFDQEDEARAALDRIAHEEPEAAEHVALLSFDDEGKPVGDAVTVSDAGVSLP